jgi:hypothetical protein
MTDATLSPEFLARINEAITDEFEKNSRLRKILPAEVDMPGGRYGVVVPRVKEVNPPNNTSYATTNVLRPPITLTREFMVAMSQLDDLDLVLNMARDAVRRMSALEDRIIAYGGLQGALPQPIPATVTIDTPGLFGPLEDVLPIALRPARQGVGSIVTAAIQKATADLEAGAPSFGGGSATLPPFHPPYAAALAPLAWQDYVPSDEDEEKSAIAAALQSRMVAPVPGGPTIAFNLGLVAGLRGARTAALASGNAHQLEQDVRATLATAATRSRSEFEMSLCRALRTFVLARCQALDLQEVLDWLDMILPIADPFELYPFVAVFSNSPVDLDLASVRAPWAASKGHNALAVEGGSLRVAIERQALLRMKRRESVYAIWTSLDNEGKPALFFRVQQLHEQVPQPTT